MSLKNIALGLLMASGFGSCVNPHPETKEEAYALVVKRLDKGVADLLSTPDFKSKKAEDSSEIFVANTLEMLDSCEVGIHEVNNKIKFKGFAHKNTIYNLNEATAEINYVDADGNKTDPQILDYKDFRDDQKFQFALADKMVTEGKAVTQKFLQNYRSGMLVDTNFLQQKKVIVPYKND